MADCGNVEACTICSGQAALAMLHSWQGSMTVGSTSFSRGWSTMVVKVLLEQMGWYSLLPP